MKALARRLLEQALAVSQPVKSRTQKARSTALDLASTQLDRLLDLLLFQPISALMTVPLGGI
jgi:hypothetical protein